VTAPARSYAGVLVLFDWNGTIVMDRDRAWTALNGVLEPRGLPPVGFGEFGSTFQLPMSVMFTGLGVPAAESGLAEAEWNAGIAAREAPARRGAVEVLDALDAGGAALGIVSAADRHPVMTDATRLGLASRFSTIDTSATDKERVLRARRGDSAHAFYVGDTVYDIRCAVRAGYVAVGVDAGYAPVDDLRQAGADAVVDDLRELLDLVDGARGDAALI